MMIRITLLWWNNCNTHSRPYTWHICLYLKKSKTLIAGDLLHITDGELTGPNSRNTPDMDSATAAIQKFLNYDIDQVVSYHGGLFKSNLSQKITELSHKLS